MSKEVSCKVLKTYCTVDDTPSMDTVLCEISWNNRSCAGLDIRKHEKEKDMYLKGITISYDGFKDIVKSAIENNFIKESDIEEALSRKRKKIVSDSDMHNIFSKMNREDREYTRDRYGRLVDDEHCLVIRRKDKK